MRSSIVFRRGDEHPAPTRSPVVLALDTDDLDQALDWAERAGPAIGMSRSAWSCSAPMATAPCGP